MLSGALKAVEDRLPRAEAGLQLFRDRFREATSRREIGW
jgi:hypothetical protein